MPLTENQKHNQKLKMRQRREEVYRQEELLGIRPIYIKQKAKNKKSRKLYSIDSKTKLNVFSKEKIPSTVITFD